MWIADNWKDYEVIDTSDGEKLERWGEYILVRPDPQVIWSTGHDEKRWKKKTATFRKHSAFLGKAKAPGFRGFRRFPLFQLANVFFELRVYGCFRFVLQFIYERFECIYYTF